VLITSRSNPVIKQVRSLRQRKERDASGLFVVEGIRHVGEAAEALVAGHSYATFEFLCVSPVLLKGEFAKELVQAQAGRGVPLYELPPDLFESLAEKENPQGLLAVMRQRPTGLAGLSAQNFPWGVALVQPQDPGNLGTILRTVDAVSADGLILLESSADLYHPGAVRASMGTLFWYPVVKASFDDFKAWAQEQRYCLIGTSAHGSVDYRDVKEYPRPLILLMGSEREGLSPDQAAACSQVIRLPMRGRASSLNLAVACGVMMYEIYAKSGEKRA
jgi:RNA methyltransferase, TrmH family